jgi:hypothetical protein
MMGTSANGNRPELSGRAGSSATSRYATCSFVKADRGP